MPSTPQPAAGLADAATPRAVADAYLLELVELDPLLATQLGTKPDEDRLPDASPAGLDARADLARRALARLAEVAPDPAALEDVERRCAALLRERLEASLAQHDAGEGLRALSNLFSPVHAVRGVFLLMPTSSPQEWAVVARRLAAVPEAYASYRASLEEGRRRGLLVGPRQVEVVVGQLGEWLGEGSPDGRSFWRRFADGASQVGDAQAGDVQAGDAQAGQHAQLRASLDAGVAAAERATAELRDHLRDVYAPDAGAQPDPVGRERYARAARAWNGADLDLEEAYAWGWSEVHRLEREMVEEAGRVLPGATVREAMDHLDAHGEAEVGEEAIRARLQRMMDDAIEALDGVHVDLAEPVKRVEAMIAPPGSAAAPYYTRPSLDFARPGRTWLPTLGEERFPLWDLVSTWYHEGVPGHHLQLAQWVLVAPQLSRYQTSIGSVSACTEGWALYAERLMDELGFLRTPGERLGYLEAQMMRAVRVVIDIGMHLELEIPADSGFHPGERWTPALARELFAAHSGRGDAFVDSEITRYLGMPGQAITYKLGERAWLAGRAAAQAAAAERGEAFDAKAWHMAALSLGSLGLDDLERELARLP